MSWRESNPPPTVPCHRAIEVRAANPYAHQALVPGGSATSLPDSRRPAPTSDEEVQWCTLGPILQGEWEPLHHDKVVHHGKDTCEYIHSLSLSLSLSLIRSLTRVFFFLVMVFCSWLIFVVSVWSLGGVSSVVGPLVVVGGLPFLLENGS